MLSGQVNWAITRRTEKTRPCNSRGVWVCQIACEWAFISGTTPLITPAVMALRYNQGDRPKATWASPPMIIGTSTP